MRAGPRVHVGVSSASQVGAGDVVDVHEVAHLPAVLEDLRRLTPLEEDRNMAATPE